MYRFIVERKDEVNFDELVKWAEENNVGSITLSIALNDLINWRKIKGLEGFFEPENCVVAFPVPRSVKIVEEKVEGKEEETSKVLEEKPEAVEEVIEAGVEEEQIRGGSKVVAVVKEEEEAPPEIKGEKIDNEDLKRAIEYLNDYWSVGVIRLLHDIKSLGISNPDLILKKLIDLEYVVYLPIGVVNATSNLPRIKRSKKLSEFI